MNDAPQPPVIGQMDDAVGVKFVHGIDLNNELLVHNLGVAGRLYTPDYVGTVDPYLSRSYRPIGSIPLEELASEAMPGNVLSPRSASYFVRASILDKGHAIIDGLGERHDLSEGSKRRIVDTRDLELAFEDGRRHFAPSAPSRLSCIWLAEDNSAGHAVIRAMLRNPFIANVRIAVCTRITKVDAGWFDDYFNAAKPEFIEKYWTGVQHPKAPMPEILVDGVVEFTEPDQLVYIKQHGKSFTSG